ncbi:MAG: aldo/keto reductase, partial [Mycobacteriales bacterium]
AETVLSRALQGVPRDSYELFTKAYWPTGPGANDRGLSRKHIIRSCEASLRRLGTDYLDLYQAHRYDYETPLEETLRAFDDLVRQGKVLYVGVSEWKATEISDALRLAQKMGIDRLVSNQPQYNMLWRVIESEVVPLCRRRGVGQLVWSPIGQGILSGKYRLGERPPDGSRVADNRGGGEFMSRFLSDDVLSRVRKLEPLAADAGLTLPQLAIAWVLQNDNVSAAVIGASRPAQVREDVKASGVVLEAELMRRIDDILDPVVERDPARTTSPKRRP